MNEPFKTIQTGDPGREAYSEEQYKEWLLDLRPYLELCNSLYRACIKSGLEKHYTTIRKKYAENDWFSVKVDAYRGSAGEDGNEAEVRMVRQVLAKIKQEEKLTREEIDILKHFNEKHRTAQPFFVTRNETAEADDSQMGKIIEPVKIDYVIPEEKPADSTVAEDQVPSNSEATPSLVTPDGQNN